ncbi:amidohydrolase family protein [Pendulispora albinea]|uniref:Amidohydrolase family protein n=1 Tax=Pendulispora albinea TaxID=2741071 RepID=A0ABZ2MB00_9BACT
MAPLDPQPQTIVLRAARLLDGNGAEPLADAALVLHGETITAVGPAHTVPIPLGARVIDYGDKSIMPGLVSNHAHVGLVDGVDVGARFYTRANILRQLRQYEAYGVTTVTSLGLNGPLFRALREEMHAGATPGADLFGVESGVGTPCGAPPASMVPVGDDQLFRPDTPEEARTAVRAMAARGTDLVKVWLDDFRGTVPVKMPPAVYRAAIDEAHALGLRVAAHIHDREDARAITRAGADILAHGVRDVPVDAELVQWLAEHRVWYIPTLSLDETTFVFAERPEWTLEPFVERALAPAVRARIDDPQWRERTLGEPRSAFARSSLAMNLRNVKTLFDAGIPIGFGSDSGVTPLRLSGASEHRELGLLVDAGLTPLQAITTATKNAAALLGLTDRGVLAVGKKADLVVLDGDPSRTIANTKAIVAVWHRGRLASGRVETFESLSE